MDAQDIANVLGEIKGDGAFIRFTKGVAKSTLLWAEIGNLKESRFVAVYDARPKEMITHLLQEVRVLNA